MATTLPVNSAVLAVVDVELVGGDIDGLAVVAPERRPIPRRACEMGALTSPMKVASCVSVLMVMVAPCTVPVGMIR